LFLGVDGGGSKCRAVIVSADGTVLGSGVAGPANPFQGYDQSLHSITRATQQALASAGLVVETSAQLHACLGLAGVNLPAIQQRLMGWSHPFADLLIATDLHIAFMGAHRGEDGAVIISGTGSCGYAFVGGRETVLGGHGFPCGDKGGGAWIGLEAVKHVLLTLDGLAEPTALCAPLLRELDAADGTSLVEKLGDHMADDYARLTPVAFAVAAAGDAVATRIIMDGAAYLTQLARQLWAERPPRMSLIGGLAPLLTPWLDRDVVARLSPPLEQPEMGSIRLAMRRWQDKTTN
jgi:glucosamine kinase